MKKALFFLLFPLAFFLLPSLVSADIGRVQTKRERLLSEKKEALSKTTPHYEAVLERFLKEDYGAVIVMTENFPESKRESFEVLYLRALSLIQLKRMDEGRDLLKKLEQSAPEEEARARVSASIGESYSAERGAAQKRLDVSARPVLRQIAVEETPLYHVQVGSFSSEKNARALVQRLKVKQYDVYLDKTRGDKWIRVQVGHLHSRDEAAKLETELQRDGLPTHIAPRS